MSWRLFLLCIAVLASSPARGQTPSPVRLGLLSSVTAPWPTASAGDAHPEKISIQMGENDNFEFSHARAYVHAPLLKVLEAFRHPEVVVDRRRITEWQTTMGVDRAFPFSFHTNYIIRALVTVEMPITWRGGVMKGTLAAPEVVGLSGQKVGGTSFVSLLEDSIVARALDANNTAIEFIRQAKGMRYGKQDCAQYQQDLFQSILSFVRGQPLPTYK